MIVIMKPGCTNEQIDIVQRNIEAKGLSTHIINGANNSVIGIIGDTTCVDQCGISLLDGVEDIVRINEPFKKANRKMKAENTIIDVNGIQIGGKKIQVFAGPCSIESQDQISLIAREVKKSGAGALRGGAFKPRTSPYSFQGLGKQGLDFMKNAADEAGMPIITEILDPRHIEMFEDTVDIFQIGARNMQNYELLKEVGKSKKPVMLKRGFAATIDEWIMSAEYIMAGGNENVMLCERGIRTFSKYTRNTLDLSCIPVLKKLTHLPVIIDPSHACGKAYMVESMALASVAAGADGLIIEVHNDPKNAWSDGAQSLTPAEFDVVMKKIAKIAEVVGREL